MRILVAGNLANIGFEIVKAMRSKGVEVNLLMPKNSHQSSDPKSLYPDLKKTGYPKWVIIYDNDRRGFGFKNWKLQVIKEMRNNYDCIIALTEFSIFAMLSGKPYGALSTGSDMRELFFEKSLKGFLYKLSYKFARMIIWGEPDKLELIKKLGIINKSVFCTVPRIFHNNSQKIIKKNELVDKIIIFHPSSQCWKSKGNDEFLNAFIKFCTENKNVFLILTERGADLYKTKEILEKNVSNDRYMFVPTLDSTQMQYYYNLSDIVIDQFKVGSLGMIAVEAMKMGKPVITYLNKDSFKKCYNNYPEKIINVKTDEEILNELRRICKDPIIAKKIGFQNKKWVEQNWDFSKLTERFIKICKAIIEKDIKLVGNCSKIE